MENPNEPAKFFFRKIFVIDTKLLTIKERLFFLAAALEVFNRFQIFPQFIGNGSQGRTLAVVLVCFPYIPDNGAYIVQCDMTEIIIVIYMSGLQRFQMRVILSGAIPFYDFMPYGINKGIEVLDLHGCNAVHIDFNVSQKLDKIEMAVDDDIIRKNPAKDALGDNGEPAKEKMALTPSQQNRLLSFVEQSSVYNVYLPMLQIMIGTGCRCGELIGLTWADVDMEKKEVSISCQLIYKNYGDGYKFHVSTPKTDAGIRKIPMSETVYKAFAAQKRQNFLQQIPRNVEIEGRTDFIFMSKNGRPLMPSAVNNVLYNIVAAYNKQETEQAKKEKREAECMPSISAHTLRHTGCTRMAEQGLDMKVVQYIMGHANIGVTMEVYNHITERARIENEIAKMDAVQVV